MGYEQQEEYIDPQPDTVTSLCYSCNNYETCHEKKSTVTSCNAYVNRAEAKKHEIIIAAGKYEEITSGKLTFLLLKKDGYKEGEEITLAEHEDGSATGRKIYITVQYIWQDWTGLDDDYCIIGFKVSEVLKEAAKEAAGGAGQPVLMPGA